MEGFPSVSPTAVAAVGLIGAGAWGANILRTLAELGALRACADSDAAVRARVAALYPDILCVHDYRRLLASDVAAVVIATPANTHYEIARAALEAGKDVFVEKPLTLDVDQAEELQQLARQLCRILMVGHLSLYQPAVPWLARCLASGALGRIVSLHQERLGLGRPRVVENALWCLGSHDVALQLYLLRSMPRTVQVQGQCIVQQHVEDDVYLHLMYPGDVQGHLHVSWSWPERRRQLTIVGIDGMLQYDELNQRVSLHRKTVGRGLDPVDRGEEVQYFDVGQPLRTELAWFVDSIRQRRSLDAETSVAVDVVRLLAAADDVLSSEPTHGHLTDAFAAGEFDHAAPGLRLHSYL